MLKIVHSKFLKKDPVGEKNKEFNYKMLDLDWDDMLAQGLVNILGSMVSAATTHRQYAIECVWLCSNETLQKQVEGRTWPLTSTLA